MSFFVCVSVCLCL